jgi:hypothetical protein
MFIETAILDPSPRGDDGEITVTPAQAGAQNLSGHPIGRHTNCSSNRKGRLPALEPSHYRHDNGVVLDRL